MSEEWRELAVFTDRASAEVLAGLLRSESLSPRIVADEPVPGLIRSISVSVPVEQWVRARDICSQAQLTDEEWSHYIQTPPGSEQEETE